MPNCVSWAENLGYSWIMAQKPESPVIGYNNPATGQSRIPWRSSPDLAFFREATQHSAVIVGRRTWDSILGQSYPKLSEEARMERLSRNRHWFVLSRSQKQCSIPIINHEAGSIHMLHSPASPGRVVQWIDFALYAIRDKIRHIWIAGGVEIYQLFNAPIGISDTWILDAPFSTKQWGEVDVVLEPRAILRDTSTYYGAPVVIQGTGVQHRYYAKEPRTRGKIPDIFLR